MLSIILLGTMKMNCSHTKVRFRGTALEVKELAEDLRRIGHLPPGGFALLGALELVVGDAPSTFDYRIVLPADAWGILAAKFADVAYGREETPFDFNECGYLQPPLPLDLGVELLGAPLLG